MDACSTRISSGSPTPLVYSDSPAQKELFEKNELKFLNLVEKEINILFQAIKESRETPLNPPVDRSGCFARLRSYVSSKKLNEENLIEICRLWDFCVEGLNHQQPEILDNALHGIISERREHPIEFKALTPGITDQQLRKSLYSIYAVSSIFRANLAIQALDTPKIISHINRSMHYFKLAGVPSEDPSLLKYTKTILNLVNQINNAKKSVDKDKA